MLLSHSGEGATILLIIHDGSTIIQQPETTNSVPYSVTLIFRQSDFHTAFFQSTFYSQYIKFTENSFLYHFLTWIKAIFYASYHLYRLFRWSTPQISALGRVTIAPIFRRAVKVGQKLIMTYQVCHSNVNATACASPHVSRLTGRLYHPQIR